MGTRLAVSRLITVVVPALLVGMYLRTTQRRNRDGSVVRYIQLAHNQRVGGVTQARVLANPGPRGSAGSGRGAAAGRLDQPLPGRTQHGRNRFRRVGRGRADRGRVASGRRGTPARRAVAGAGRGRRSAQGRGCTPVHHRRGAGAVRTGGEPAIEPKSKLSAAEWAVCDVAIDGLAAAMDEDQAYRAMDLLAEADAQAEVQEAVFFAVADLLNLEVDLLFFDTTSTYFERDTEEAGEDAFRVYGHSKDHRRPAADRDRAGRDQGGHPGRVWCWPGNANDAALLPQVRDDIRGWRLGRVITVVDRGFSSADNLAYLRRGGGHFIAGMRMRDGNPLTDTVLSRPGRYQQVQDNLRVKEVNVDDTEVRYVICHNPEQAERPHPARGRRHPPADRAGPDREGPRQDSEQQEPHRQTQRRGRAHEGPVRVARSPRTRPLAAPAGQRAPRDRPGQGQGRGQAGRQIPDRHLRPAHQRPGRRAGLQETSSRPNAASAT